MKISCNWLRTYLSEHISIKELEKCLTATGLEVEGQEKYTSLPVTTDTLVVGKVVSVNKHPGADKLRLTKVETGSANPSDIVCGAPNVEKGQKVIVALPGTVFYENGEEKLTIRSNKIRGENSEGMICSEKELGISDDHSGIMVLETDKPPGTPAKEVLDIYEDTVLEIGLTPNRGDAASHLGCARDVAAAKGFKVVYPSVKDFKEDKSVKPSIQVNIDNPADCMRYAGLSMKNARVSPSPPWLQHYLKAAGLRPINNIVDLSAFVMLETGQPLHIFDKDKLKGNISVARAGKKQSFQTLDEEVHNLEGNELMIKDEEKPVAIAGVMGGLNSSVNDSTVNLFLESACFDPITIRKAAGKHHIFSDAAFRYERGVDPNLAGYALKRLAILLNKHAGAEFSESPVDVYPEPVKPRALFFSFQYLNDLTGQEIPAKKVQEILEALDFEITEATDKGLSLKVPTYRTEVLRPADVAEEVLRIYSYDAIEIPEGSKTVFHSVEKPSPHELTERMASYLSSAGFREIISNSLTDQKRTASFESEASIIQILNPLSNELNIMRPDALYTGLDAIRYNLNRKNRDLKFFETGKSFINSSSGYTEQESVFIYATGNRRAESWYEEAGTADHFYIKAIAENILKMCGLDESSFQYAQFSNKKIARGQSIILGGEDAGLAGQVSPFLLKAMSINQAVFYCRIDLEPLMHAVHNAPPLQYKPVNKYPFIRRDLSVMISRDIAYETLQNKIREAAGKLLTKIRIFDVYEGEKIEEGYKSYAVKLIFESEEKTLRDEEMDEILQGIISSVERDLKANVRKS